MSAFGTLVATEQRFLESPLRVKRVGFVMSAVCPVYPQQQTSPDTVGTSHLCQGRTFDGAPLSSDFICFAHSFREVPMGGLMQCSRKQRHHSIISSATGSRFGGPPRLGMRP
jgi:hypothetical protein